MTSMIYNVNRKKGTPPKTPGDFLRSERKHMTVEEAKGFMDAWAAARNKEHEA